MFHRAQHIGDFPQRLQNGLLVVGQCGLRGCFGGFGLRLQTGREQRLCELSAQSPDQRTSAKQAGDRQGLRSQVRAQCQLGVELGKGYPMLRAGSLQQGFRSAHIGPVPRQLGWHAQRQLCRQGEILQLEFRQRRLPRCLPRQHRQQMTCLRKAFSQGRQGGLRLLQLGLQRQHLAAAEPERHPVTGLYTRPVLMKKLAAQLPSAEGGALLVEVGNAAALRNRFGYAGFETLMNDAGRHLGSIANTHAVARLSDNAFLVVVAQHDCSQMDAYARTLRDGLGYQDFSVGNETLRLRGTIGHAHLGHGFTDAGSVLAAAEQAASDARALPISVAAYVPPKNTGTTEDGILRELRAALAGDKGLQLAFQPVVAVAGGDEAQFQVLLRLQGSNGTEYLAGEFIPAADAAGLMPQLDRWTMEQSLALMKQRRAESRPVRLFVSQTPRTLGQDNNAEWLTESLERAGVDGTSLVIDLRLDEALMHSMLLRQFCEQMVPTGVQFCLSQYRHGTDADVLLQQLPLGFVRLSAAFANSQLPDALRDEMREVIERAHGLGLHVIGQAVEDPQAAAALWMGGIDFMQGNLVKRAEHALNFDFKHAIL